MTRWLIFLFLCFALCCATSHARRHNRRSTVVDDTDESPVKEHLLPRRTFLHVTTADMNKSLEQMGLSEPPDFIRQFLKSQYSRFVYIRDFGGENLSRDSQFCAALFPIGYITPKLLALRKRPCFDTLFAAEREIPANGYYNFPHLPALIENLSVDQFDSDFQPDVHTSYLAKNPQVACSESAKVEAYMRTLYTTPERAVCALQLGQLACTMASFDMAYYAHKTALTGKSAPENWTRRENIGGAGHSGGRTESEVRNDFEKYGVRAEAITRPKEHSFKKRDVELSSQDAHDIDTFIQKYGPCIGSLQHYGHANIIDGFYFSETTDEPVAMFIRDPMYALAFAIPWEKARVMVEYDCLFVKEETNEESD
eukprot:gnl/Spiro4/8385_TR4406_c0_g1_i1.p1 gnl/Spiro4/8385_TR4406_c0_g1~~gnl/Spiro4/8385_TR4406_c0_g1_i1.p1  ORF type:complete len:378 (-),score=67.88 gnl/Spiro4/8385_TR4406_c0_g1_i1:28-1131(-)